MFERAIHFSTILLGAVLALVGAFIFIDFRCMPAEMGRATWIIRSVYYLFIFGQMYLIGYLLDKREGSYIRRVYFVILLLVTVAFIYWIKMSPEQKYASPYEWADGISPVLIVNGLTLLVAAYYRKRRLLFGGYFPDDPRYFNDY